MHKVYATVKYIGKCYSLRNGKRKVVGLARVRAFSPLSAKLSLEKCCKWLELRRLPPIMGFVGSGLPGLVTLLA